MNSHVIVGKYPSTSNYLSTPGSIMDDGAKVWSWRISFDLTTVPYRNVLAAIQNEKKHPSTYQLNSANCVQWVEQLAVLTLEYGFSGYIVMGDDPTTLSIFGQEVAPGLRELVAAER
jgi:hypothetical protein